MNFTEAIDRMRGFFTDDRADTERRVLLQEREEKRNAIVERIRRLDALLQPYDTPVLTNFLAQVGEDLRKMQERLVAADDLNEILRLQGQCRVMTGLLAQESILRREHDALREELAALTDAG